MITTVCLENNSKKEYFLIHGYTGSPTDFNELPQYLHAHYKVDVKIILLRGHGTKIEDLDHLELNDFLEQAKEELKKDLQKYDEIILGGVSFGAELALLLSAQFPVKGVFSVSLPYKLKFPFNIPDVELLVRYKKYWKKIIPEQEKKLRQNTFYYEAMHVNILKIMRKANYELRKALPKIQCPVLTIVSTHDPIGNYKAIKNFEKKLQCPHDKILLTDKNHNIFFTKNRYAIYDKIGNFFEGVCLIDKPKTARVAAIVPAYNEEKNIARVLEVLTKSPILHEIIVIDDGSIDNTADAVRSFPQIRLLVNEKNKGKAYSLQRGINSTDAEILFFCDADLRGLTPDIVKQIVQPIIDRQYGMFIGVRNNVMQKTIRLFSINSGERALRRELWERMPDIFKFRYRMEPGLNFIAKTQKQGYGWKKFYYYHSIKEKKYGVIRGTMLRWWMNFDIGYAYIIAILRATIRKKV